MTASGMSPPFARAQVGLLRERLAERRRYLQVVTGPRQSGKTTLVLQALVSWGNSARYASADEPTVRDRAWLSAQWEASRLVARESGISGAVLALDEIQKIPGWAEIVKSLWDEDTRHNLPLHVVVLGSAPLLVQRGLSDSLTGRFETILVGHWSFSEMREAFGLTLEQYVFFGGYPGAVSLVDDPSRWTRYIRDSIIETTLSRDVLLLTRVDKPALLRQLFELGCRYSGQVLSYTKMLGQLQDAGNTITLAHYLELLARAGMLTGLQKFTGSIVRSRGSSPKLQALNAALMTATLGLDPAGVRTQPELWGRLVESAVGAHLADAAARGQSALHYWREGNREVDFVVTDRGQTVAIEVKSGRRRERLSGLGAFTAAFPSSRTLLVGADGIPLEEFLGTPVVRWLRP